MPGARFCRARGQPGGARCASGDGAALCTLDRGGARANAADAEDVDAALRPRGPDPRGGGQQLAASRRCGHRPRRLPLASSNRGDTRYGLSRLPRLARTSAGGAAVRRCVFSRSTPDCHRDLTDVITDAWHPRHPGLRSICNRCSPSDLASPADRDVFDARFVNMAVCDEAFRQRPPGQVRTSRIDRSLLRAFAPAGGCMRRHARHAKCAVVRDRAGNGRWRSPPGKLPGR